MHSKKWFLKAGLPAALATIVLAVAPARASAQSHDQRLERQQFKQHERQERAIYGERTVRGHQRGERGQFQAEERAERSGWYGGGDGNWANNYPGPYGRGGFHNRNYPRWYGQGSSPNDWPSDHH